VPGVQPECIVSVECVEKRDKQDAPGTCRENAEWVIAAILIRTRPGEDTGLVQGQPQFVIELSRGTLEVKKEGRWKRYQCEGLGVILTRKHKVAGWCS
jgi:hypothetical protein